VIILDANVLIGFLDANDPHSTAANELLERRFVEGFGSSVLTVAAALVHPTRADKQDAAMAALLRVGVQVVPLNANDAPGVARVRSTYRLRMPDAGRRRALHRAEYWLRAGYFRRGIDRSRSPGWRRRRLAEVGADRCRSRLGRLWFAPGSVAKRPRRTLLTTTAR
jgi:hypothetical protein